MAKTGISRRRFIKSGIAGILGAAAHIGAAQQITSSRETIGVSRTSLKPLRAIPTTCEQCPAGCGIIAYLDGDRLVQLLGNPNHPNNKGSICAKGIAGINLVNDPERLLYPLKRIGPRGGGKWTRITWDEVYTILGGRIKELISNGRAHELVIDTGQNDALLERFAKALGTAKIIDRQVLKNINHDTIYTSMIGTSSLIEDVGRSRTILNFGANPYANHDQFIGIARRLVQAQVEKGTKLITFDVRMSETAAKSDVWYPVKAGTDGIVALAMAKIIVDKGLADKHFLENRTNLRISTLKHHLSHYTPVLAERESGVKATDIEKLAVIFATQNPSVAMMGGGAIEHENGSQNVRCIALLNWLVGNLEKEGGLFFPRFYDADKSNMTLLNYKRSNMSSVVKGITEILETQTRIDTYFAYLSNPAYTEPDCESAVHFLKDEKMVPFLVVMDTHFTETAMKADMVLPAATYLEGWGVKSFTSLDMVPILNLKQPVVSLLSDAQVLRSPAFDVGKLLEPSFRPKGEAKEVGNICLELARRIGGNIAKNLPFKDTLDYVKRVTSSFPALEKQGGLNVIKRQGLWIDKIPSKGVKDYRPGQKIQTRTQKIEIYSNTLKQSGHSPLPEYQPVATHKEKKQGEFILTTFKSNLWANGTANSKWAREILHENRLWINMDVANKLGIKNGNKVRVTSPAGTFITRVLTTHRIHPESVALAEGLGHTATGNLAKAKKFRSKDRDTNLIWWGKKGNGVNPNKIIKSRKDPISGGLGLKDTVVRIEKI